MSNFSTTSPQMSLFSADGPLAYRIRPQSREDLIGQTSLFSNDGILSSWLENKIPYSVVLWGPPGSGKTTIAFIAQNSTNKEFVYVSGASTNIAELRKIIDKSKKNPIRSILFVDEIHRLAKNQQDVLLEPLESGEIILIGTTTENPHVSLTRALHSRIKVIELKPPGKEDLKNIVVRAINHPQGLKGKKVSDEAIDLLVNSASGDIRRLLFNLEEVSRVSTECEINKEQVEKILKDSQLQIGSDADSHYHYVSALQKSIRGSDIQASVYWLGRLLSGGADPVHVARRILVAAAEDIGLADTNALTVAVNAFQAASFLGMPEARIPLSEAVIYLASAPKSNSAYMAINTAMEEIKNETPYSVPIHIRNLGGEGYKYPHNYEGAKVEQEYLPKELKDRQFYKKNERDNF